MARLKQTDNIQGQFMAVNLKEQLLPDTFEWTIDYLINKTDMSLFKKNKKMTKEEPRRIRRGCC